MVPLLWTFPNLMLVPLLISIECFEHSFQLYSNRYEWDALTTFYYHWYHIDGFALSNQQMSQIRYSHWYGFNPDYTKPRQTFKEFRSEMAMLYPTLIDNAQFICCFEKDDPYHKLAGRVPYIGKLKIEPPYYDHEYALKHYYGYNKRFIDLLPTAEGEPLREVNYLKERRIWRRQFIEHHACYGEYYRWVHEYPNTAEYREEDFERPSHYPPNPDSIIKEPKGAYIKYFSYGIGFGGLFLVLAKNFLLGS